MKKKIGVGILAMSMVFANICPVSAAQAVNEPAMITVDYDMMPYYDNIETVRYIFQMDKEGNASFGCDVYTQSATKIKIQAQVQQAYSGGWTTVYTDTFTDYDDYTTYSDEVKLNPAKTYRVHFTVSVYYGNGQVEVVEQNKY